MTVKANIFKAIADSLITDVFGEFQKELVMREMSNSDVGEDPEATTETGTGILIELTESQFQGQAVESGDFFIATNASQWETNPSVDNIEMEFDGVAISVKAVKKDADNAAYTIMAKRK